MKIIDELRFLPGKDWLYAVRKPAPAGFLVARIAAKFVKITCFSCSNWNRIEENESVAKAFR
jgi:hypothetical protein